MPDPAHQRHVLIARIVTLALMASCVIYAAVAWLTLRGGGLGTKPVAPSVQAILVTYGLLALLGAPFMQRFLLARAVRQPGAWVAAGIVAHALRESAAVIGLLLTFMTGTFLPVLVGTGLAVGAMALAFPGADDLESYLRGA